MKPECAAQVKEVLGREPTKGELDGIQTRLFSSMQELQAQDPTAWRSLSRDERLRQGAKLARAKTLADMTRAHANTVRDLTIKAREMDRLGSVAPGVGKGKGQLKALNQRTLFAGSLEGKGVSLDKEIEAVRNDAMRQLDAFGGKGKFFGAIQNPGDQHELIRAVFGEDTGKPEVNKAGKTVAAVMEFLHQRANDAGIVIHHLDNWRLPQPWAWENVAANREQFVADVMDRLDRSKYMNRDGSPMAEADIKKLVEASAETLGTNGANKRAEKQGTGHSGSVGGSRNAPRQLHFKDADAYIHMMDTYGSANNAFSLVTHHISGMARDIATAERFGRDADNYYPQLLETAFKNDVKATAASDLPPAKKEAALKKLDDQKKQAQRMWEALRSPDHPGSTPLWAKVSQAIRGVAQSTLLGSSTLSAIPDLQMAVGYTHLRGIARTRILGHITEGLKPTAENVRRIERLGIVTNTVDASAHRMGNDEMGNGAVKFLNHTVHVASGLRMWDRGMTHGTAASIMDILGEHSHAREFHQLDGASAKMAQQYGITPDHWATWRLAELDKGPNGNHSMVTPDGIYAIPDEKLQPLAEQRLAARGAEATPTELAREIRNLRSEAAKQLLATALSETQIGARGGAGSSLRDQLKMGLEPGARGTLRHEMLSWLFLLKQTPLGIAKTHMWDVPHSMDTWGAAAMYRAKFMAGSALLGAVSQELKNMALGQDPEDLMTPKGLGKVALASGGFGMYGDFAFGDKGDHQNGALAKFLGPGATMAEDALNLGHNAIDVAKGTAGIEAEPGDPALVSPDKLAAQAARFGHSYVAPLTRIWYVKAAFNHLVYQQVMENLAPGYNARVEQRMAQRHQSNWWRSGEITPDRAPALGGQP